MLAFLKRLLLAVLLLVLAVFVVQNLAGLGTLVALKFQANFWAEPAAPVPSVTLPVGLLLAAAFLLGMLAAGLREMVRSVARRSDLRGRDKRIRELERELAEWKALGPGSGPRAGAPGSGPEPAQRLSPDPRRPDGPAF